MERIGRIALTFRSAELGQRRAALDIKREDGDIRARVDALILMPGMTQETAQQLSHEIEEGINNDVYESTVRLNVGGAPVVARYSVQNPREFMRDFYQAIERQDAKARLV